MRRVGHGLCFIGDSLFGAKESRKADAVDWQSGRHGRLVFVEAEADECAAALARGAADWQLSSGSWFATCKLAALGRIAVMHTATASKDGITVGRVI